jgi:CBS domain containing-hemolysin-like protein
MIWLALVFLLCCSGCISASETSLFGLNPQALHQFGRSGNALGRRVFQLMRAPRRMLMTILITNTAVNVAIFAISFIAADRLHDDHPTIAAAANVGVLFAVIVFGELVPKAIALSNARFFAPIAAAIITVLQLVLSPAHWILGRWVVDPLTRLLAPSARASDVVSTDELRLLVEHSACDGHIDAAENDWLQAVVSFSDVSVREVMTPRVDIRFVFIDCDRETAIATARDAHRRQLPVCGRDLDAVRGVLRVRDLYLKPNATVRSLVRRVRFVPEQANLIQLLRHFREARSHLAIVVDEYGGTSGLVTTEDVVQRIVGILPDADPAARTDGAECIDENTYRIPAGLSARAWADRFGADIPAQVDTVAGLILSRLGRMPRVGDRVIVRNLTLTVESMLGRRIQHVLLQRRSDPAPTGGGEA